MNNTEVKTAAQAQMLANRLHKRYRHLQKWAQRENISAFRLYDRDIPEIPLVLDLYNDVVSGALYKRPYEKDKDEEARWLAAMGDAVARILKLDRDNIIIKQRERQRGQNQYEKIATKGVTRIINEGELRFKVNLSDYLDTGLFLDRRALRRMVGADSNGKRILNLFCYTGSFSVHAAVGVPPYGGAASTDSVDLSNTYLNRARENFLLNGFNTQLLQLEEFWARSGQPSCAHRLVHADVGAFLHQAVQARYKSSARRWDSIIIDPPVFSNSSTAGDFDLNRDYRELLAHCLTLLSPNGKIWFSASARSFKANAEEMETALKGQFPGIKVSGHSGKLTDEDFKKIKMPKTFLLMK